MPKTILKIILVADLGIPKHKRHLPPKDVGENCSQYLEGICPPVDYKLRPVEENEKKKI